MIFASTLLALTLVAGDDSALSNCRGIENDIERLACFDKAVPVAESAEPAAPEAPPTREEQIHRAIDAMLARDLIDPSSAIDYQVSDPLLCKSVEPFYKDPTHQCVCYSVNSKNRMGGYTGAKLRAASVVESKDFYFAMGGLDVRTADGVRACGAANLADRSASLIAERVKR